MELGDLKGQHRARSPDNGGSATPLVDATVRFFEEFLFKERPPSTQQQSRPAGRNPREDDEVKKEHDVMDSFEPTYVYDAMKEKRQLKRLLVRYYSTWRPAVTDCVGLTCIGRTSAGCGRVFPPLPRRT